MFNVCAAVYRYAAIDLIETAVFAYISANIIPLDQMLIL